MRIGHKASIADRTGSIRLDSQVTPLSVRQAYIACGAQTMLPIPQFAGAWLI